ncbi:hypothetical protein MIND_00360300 [Mycena indigotica]|uniref:BED-type domain-containing protein n=1 Tax=Mycena indigotica TaxID=2126181 RepID=A0A8H6T5P9_9AGAR|nr:uncharacterized protein MIND_00360300 [Mycena indigotica]KAF7309880.1 hypothetical protein MIND_00360300 [Mycena indigotica]
MPPPTLPTSSAGNSSPPSKKKLRELKLRADSLVDVLSPTLVRCLNCGTTIKLSYKSDYDASHWTRHRGRCLKKTKTRETPKETRVSLPVQSSPHDGNSSSPGSSRAATPEAEDKSEYQSVPINYADLTQRWKSWDWSQLRSSFIVPNSP